MDVYEYRDILERVSTAEEKFPGNGPTVALLEAVLELNDMIGDLVERVKSTKKELYHIRLAVEDIAEGKKEEKAIKHVRGAEVLKEVK